MKTTQELKELLYKNKTVADQQPDAIAEANAFCEGYKAFLNAAKTERLPAPLPHRRYHLCGARSRRL